MRGEDKRRSRPLVAGTRSDDSTTVTKSLWLLALFSTLCVAAERQPSRTFNASEGCDVLTLPVYHQGHLSRSLELAATPAESASGCKYERPFTIPPSQISASEAESKSADTGGESAAATDPRGPGEKGSFTSPGADELFRVGGVGFLDAGWAEHLEMDWFYMASLLDQHGAERPIMAFDGYMHFLGLCFDHETKTHAAIFRYRYAGSCCPWEDTAYFQYDGDAQAFVKVFVDGQAPQPTGADAACRWREKATALGTYRDGLYALRVRELPDLAKDGTAGLLPSRVIATDVVELQLARLRKLSNIVRLRNAGLDSPRWKVMVVDWLGVPRPESVEVCEGALLAWDEAQQEWRSLYDCADISDIEIRGDMLSAVLFKGTGDCGWRRQGIPCHLEVDLATHEARLWDELHRNSWRSHRSRPSQ